MILSVHFVYACCVKEQKGRVLGLSIWKRLEGRQPAQLGSTDMARFL